jgi:hypothetical protein
MLMNLVVILQWIYHHMEIWLQFLTKNTNSICTKLRGTLDARSQVVKETSIKGTTQRKSSFVKGTPSSLLDFTCMATMDKWLIIPKVLHKENGLLWK